MKHPTPKLTPFNQLLIGKSPIYIFPLPYGPRAVVTCDGCDVSVYVAEYGGRREITGFSPSLEEWFMRLYAAMFSEPDPKYTKNGKQVVFPTLVFDVILSDAADSEDTDGSADALMEHLSNFDELGAPAPTGSVSALVLCVLLEEEFKKGYTTHDIWWQRSWLIRGLMKIGMGNPYSYPRPEIKPLTQSPREWRFEYNGIASDQPDVCWNMIYNCFKRQYAGALIVDVWQGWKAGGDAYRVLYEEDVEL